MTDLIKKTTALVSHFEDIYRSHMQDLPIVNARLGVEAVGFKDYGEQQLGILITPWFMNLVLLSGDQESDAGTQGESSIVTFPSGDIEFTSCEDDVLGNFRTAVLFRTVSDLPDQATAREIARQILHDLFVEKQKEGALSRRALFTGRKAS